MEKRSDKIKITHNKKLLGIIIILVILFIILIAFLANNKKQTYYFLEDNQCIKIKESSDKITFSHYKELEDCEMLIIKDCQTDADCVPATCCHPEQCVLKEKAPDCGIPFCSQVCQGPLDCGAGHCACINNKCRIISE